MKELIHEVLVERLSNAQYHPENTSQWTKDIADEIKGKLKGTPPDGVCFSHGSAI